MSLDGKIAIITGAARSIGAATLSVFVERGATVIATDKEAGPLDAMTASLPRGRVVTLVGDVTDEAVNARLVDTHAGAREVRAGVSRPPTSCVRSVRPFLPPSLHSSCVRKNSLKP